MRLEQPEHAERDAAGGEKRADGREPTGQPSCLDAATGFVFAEAEFRDAVCKERGETLFGVKAPSIHFCEMLDEPQGYLALGTCDLVKSSQERVIRETGERRHESLYHADFRRRP